MGLRSVNEGDEDQVQDKTGTAGLQDQEGGDACECTLMLCMGKSGFPGLGLRGSLSCTSLTACALKLSTLSGGHGYPKSIGR